MIQGMYYGIQDNAFLLAMPSHTGSVTYQINLPVQALSWGAMSVTTDADVPFYMEMSPLLQFPMVSGLPNAGREDWERSTRKTRKRISPLKCFLHVLQSASLSSAKIETGHKGYSTTIICGADVLPIHPFPAEDSISSIAAVVDSQGWPEITKYAGLVWFVLKLIARRHIQDLYKTWQNLLTWIVFGGMITELLISFRRVTGPKPQRIIVYSYT